MKPLWRSAAAIGLVMLCAITAIALLRATETDKSARGRPQPPGEFNVDCETDEVLITSINWDRPELGTPEEVVRRSGRVKPRDEVVVATTREQTRFVIMRNGRPVTTGHMWEGPKNHWTYSNVHSCPE